MANCLEDSETMWLIHQSGGLKKLLTFAENSTIPEIQKNAAKAITKAAYDGMLHLHKPKAHISFYILDCDGYWNNYF